MPLDPPVMTTFLPEKVLDMARRIVANGRERQSLGRCFADSR